MGTDPAYLTTDDYTSASCSDTYIVVIVYVLSNIAVIECTHRILMAHPQILEKAFFWATCVALSAMAFYDRFFGRSEDEFSAISVFAVASLLIGLLLYGREEEPDCEVVTDFITA